MSIIINQYDSYGHTTKTIGQSFKSGSTNSGNYDIVQIQYSFTGQLTKITQLHYLSSSLLLTINKIYTYDPQGRKILLQQQYNSGPLVNFGEYDYNELGQLYKKSLQALGQQVGAAATLSLNSRYR